MTLIATLISHPENPAIRDAIVGMVADALDRAVDVTWLSPGVACDVTLLDIERAQMESLSAAFSDARIDCVLQDPATRRKKVLIADMDSTMIEQECIDELGAMLGLKDAISAITARAMRGEIAFEPALRERVALLKDLPVTAIDQVLNERISLRSGGHALVQTMRANGAYTALVSGGFTAFTERIARLLGFDEHCANELLHEEGVLTGKVAEPILGADAKVDALKDISSRLGHDHADCLAIGDGANDLGMIKLAGMGVALHAKPRVAAEARFQINHGDLTAILFIQGYKQSEFTTESR